MGIFPQNDGQEQEVEGTKQHINDTTSRSDGGVLRTGVILCLSRIGLAANGAVG